MISDGRCTCWDTMLDGLLVLLELVTAPSALRAATEARCRPHALGHAWDRSIHPEDA